jgi:peptidoglycan/LPS O-acetylase OafA/YrhL
MKVERFKYRPVVRTLATISMQSRDNFLLLRFIAAAMVLYGHAYSIATGAGAPEIFVWLGWGKYSGEIAVDLFFVISGYLVAGSYLRGERLLPFLWARALRILPAYLICLIGCAFVLGSAVTSLAPADYLRDPATRSYVLTNLQLGNKLIWELPGVFMSNPESHVVNGSIWTLPAEVRLYGLVALLGFCGVLRRRGVANVVLVLTIGLFAWLMLGVIAPAHPSAPIDTYVRLGALFVAGVFCKINSGWIPVHWLIFAGLALLTWLCRGTAAYACAFGLAEIAFVFCFAFATRWYGFSRFGDYSYGLYLWGFPMQQLVAYYLPALSPLQNAICGFGLALVLAIGSWHVIEQPLLRLKNLASERIPKQVAAGSA